MGVSIISRWASYVALLALFAALPGLAQAQSPSPDPNSPAGVALNGEHLDTYYVRASAFARLDDYASARATLLEAAAREPHDFVTWGLLGDLAVRRGELGQARAAYGRASRLNPRDQALRAVARDPRVAARGN